MAKLAVAEEYTLLKSGSGLPLTGKAASRCTPETLGTNVSSYRASLLQEHHLLRHNQVADFHFVEVNT